MKNFVLLCFVFIIPELAWSQQSTSGASLESKTVEMVRMTEEPVIDGILNEGVWQQAKLIADFYQTTPTEFAAPSQRTEVRIFYTENALFVGARMWEEDASQIAAQALEQYGGVNQDDVFHITLAPFQDRRSGYRFAMNPNGVWWDAIFKSPTDTDGNWQGIWQGKSSIDDEGWTAEMRIPFQTLSFDPANSEWGINFQRIIRRNNERISWYSRDRQVNPGASGTATNMAGIQQGRGLDIVPSLTLRRDKIYGTSPQSGIEENFEPSLDVFYKVTPSLNASLTVNTDFSAAEVDDRQVNLTRFSLFFPEKRDFFLRDSDIFDFGQIANYGFDNNYGTGFGAIPNASQQNARPFFSRTIGLSANGEPVDLNVGGKLSGRIGNFNVGSLLISQAEDISTGVDSTDIFVGRAVMNVLSESQVGVIMTDGDPQSNLDSTLYGADFRYRNSQLPNNKSVELNAWLQKTETDGKLGDDMAYSLALTAPNRNGWRGTGIYTRVEKNFDPAVGFVNRTGIEDYALEAGYTFLMPAGSYISSANFTADGYRADLLSTGQLSSQDLGLRLALFNKTGDKFFTRFVRATEVLQNNFTIFTASDGSRSVVIPQGSYEFDEIRFFLITAGYRKFSTTLNLLAGEYYNGDHVQYKVDNTWRPVKQLEFGVSYTENAIKLPAGDFNVRLITLQGNVAFNSRWSWSNYLQYDNISESAGFNSRLNWIPEAGQQVLLVLNYGAQDRDKDNSFTSTSSDLSVKATYTFRY